MKVAITSSGDTLSALVDRRFGRCSFFVFFDTETGETEFLANPNIITWKEQEWLPSVS